MTTVPLMPAIRASAGYSGPTIFTSFPQVSPHQVMADFTSRKYFPSIQAEGKLAPSTIFGYRHIFEKHVRKPLGNFRLSDFTTYEGRKILEKMAGKGRSVNSIKHAKWFMAAVINHAKNADAFHGSNPAAGITLRATKDNEETRTYTLEEIAAMLTALKDKRQAFTSVSCAAWTGLRASELRGLKWSDYRDGQLFVERAVWPTSVRDKRKTTESGAPVPVIPLLAETLKKYRSVYTAEDNDFIFRGAKMRRPLRLETALAEKSPPHLRGLV